MNPFAKPGLAATGLPPVGEPDNGKVLQVVGGEWEASDNAPFAIEIYYDSEASAYKIDTTQTSLSSIRQAVSSGKKDFVVNVPLDISDPQSPKYSVIVSVVSPTVYVASAECVGLVASFANYGLQKLQTYTIVVFKTADFSQVQYNELSLA